MTLAELRADVVILSCAISAGIHGALVEDHFGETFGAGVGFLVATVLLGALAVSLTRNPSQPAVIATVAVFSGLIVSYALAVTIGVPAIHPAVEPVDGLALFTEVVQAVGLVAAVSLVRRLPVVTLTQPKGSLT